MNTSGETNAKIGVGVPRLVVVDVDSVRITVTDIHEVAIGRQDVSYTISSEHQRFVLMREVAFV